MTNKIKSTLLLALLWAASLSLAACGGGASASDPDSAVSGFIDEIKKGNVDTASAYLMTPTSVEGMDSLTQAESSRVQESTSSLTYEIVSSNLFESGSEAPAEGELQDTETEAVYGGALVVVNITTKDMNAVTEKLAAAMQSQAGNFAGMSQRDMDTFWNDAIKNAMSETTETVTTPVDFVVVEDGGSWKIRQAPDFFPAAFGMGAVLDF